MGGLAPALNNKPLPGWLIRLHVRNGLGAMPAFGSEDLNDGELTDLVEYVLALRDLGGD